MTYRVVIEAPAQADIEEIFGWLAGDSLGRAERFYVGLVEAAERLKRFPKRCARAPESAVFLEEIRQLLFDRYRVLFTISGKSVHVLHVRHSARGSLTPEG